MESSETMLILEKKDHRAQEALRTGFLEKQRVLAREILNDQVSGSEKIIFEMIPSRNNRPKGIKPYLKAIRAFSITATFTPCLAVTLYSYYKHISFSWPLAACALIAVCLLQIAINIFNDVEDYRKLIDLPNTTGGSGVIQDAWWTPLQLRRIAWFSLLIGSSLGLIPLYFNFQNLIWISLFAFLGVLGYSAKTFGLKYNNLGDLAVFLLCGPALTVGYSIATTGQFNREVILIGVYFGLLAMALLHINNLQDMQLDSSRGISTLAIKLGFRKSKSFLYFLYFATYFILIFMVASRDLPKVSLLNIVVEGIILLPLLKSLRAASGPQSQSLFQSRVKAAQVHLVSGLGLCFFLLVGTFLWA
jgi:1,4-dihydroxy-2-naphthoate octaprenyltransferase